MTDISKDTPTSIRKKFSFMVKVEPQIKKTKLSTEWYSKMDELTLNELPKGNRWEYFKNERVQNARGEGFNVDELAKATLLFVNEWLENNGIDNEIELCQGVKING